MKKSAFGVRRLLGSGVELAGLERGEVDCAGRYFADKAAAAAETKNSRRRIARGARFLSGSGEGFIDGRSSIRIERDYRVQSPHAPASEIIVTSLRGGVRIAC